MRQPEPVGGEPDRILALGRVLEGAEHLADALERALTVGQCALDLDPHAVRKVVLGAGEPRLEAGRVVGGVGAGRERDDADVESLAGGELHPAQGCLLAGGIGVEAEREPLRQPTELLQLRGR